MPGSLRRNGRESLGRALAATSKPPSHVRCGMRMLLVCLSHCHLLTDAVSGRAGIDQGSSSSDTAVATLVAPALSARDEGVDG